MACLLRSRNCAQYYDQKGWHEIRRRCYERQLCLRAEAVPVQRQVASGVRLPELQQAQLEAAMPPAPLTSRFRSAATRAIGLLIVAAIASSIWTHHPSIDPTRGDSKTEVCLIVLRPLTTKMRPLITESLSGTSLDLRRTGVNEPRNSAIIASRSRSQRRSRSCALRRTAAVICRLRRWSVPARLSGRQAFRAWLSSGTVLCR